MTYEYIVASTLLVARFLILEPLLCESMCIVRTTMNYVIPVRVSAHIYEALVSTISGSMRLHTT